MQTIPFFCLQTKKHISCPPGHKMHSAMSQTIFFDGAALSLPVLLYGSVVWARRHNHPIIAGIADYDFQDLQPYRRILDISYWRKAFQCSLRETGCAQPARSIYLILSVLVESDGGNVPTSPTAPLCLERCVWRRKGLLRARVLVVVAGPVTVPMVSSNSSPPIAMPVQVPPGHMVQQVVDENGTLRHVILSHQHIMPLPPPPPPYGKRETLEKTRRQAASSGMIPTYEDLEATPSGIESVCQGVRRVFVLSSGTVLLLCTEGLGVIFDDPAARTGLKIWQSPASSEPAAPRSGQRDGASSQRHVWPPRQRYLVSIYFYRLFTIKMERRWNARSREMGVPLESPLASGIVQHDSLLQKSDGEPAGYLTRIAVVGGGRPSYCATAAVPVLCIKQRTCGPTYFPARDACHRVACSTPGMNMLPAPIRLSKGARVEFSADRGRTAETLSFATSLEYCPMQASQEASVWHSSLQTPFVNNWCEQRLLRSQTTFSTHRFHERKYNGASWIRRRLATSARAAAGEVGIMRMVGLREGKLAQDVTCRWHFRLPRGPLIIPPPSCVAGSSRPAASARIFLRLLYACRFLSRGRSRSRDASQVSLLSIIPGLPRAGGGGRDVERVSQGRDGSPRATHNESSPPVPASALHNVRACSGDPGGYVLHRNLCAETYRFPATNKTPPHHMLTSPTSATYCTLFIFRGHVQEGLDVMASDVLHKHGTTYHVLVHTITNTWKSEIRRSHNPRQQVFHRGLVNQALHVAPQEVVERTTGWIGRGDPITWPARSPDLTSLDYFRWDHTKGLIYETPRVLRAPSHTVAFTRRISRLLVHSHNEQLNCWRRLAARTRLDGLPQRLLVAGPPRRAVTRQRARRSGREEGSAEVGHPTALDSNPVPAAALRGHVASVHSCYSRAIWTASGAVRRPVLETAVPTEQQHWTRGARSASVREVYLFSCVGEYRPRIHTDMSAEEDNREEDRVATLQTMSKRWSENAEDYPLGKCSNSLMLYSRCVGYKPKTIKLTNNHDQLHRRVSEYAFHTRAIKVIARGSVSANEIGPGPGAGSNQPGQQFYTTQGIMPGYPPHFGHGNPMQPGVLSHVPSPGPPQGHSPPPPHSFHKDERTHRQYIKLKRKLEQKQRVISVTEMVNGLRRSKDRGAGLSDEGDESSSLQDEEEDEAHLIAEMLSTVKSPVIAELNSRTALLQWAPPALETKNQELMVSESDLRYEVLLSDKGKEGKYKSIYNGLALSCRIQDLRPGTEYSVCVQVHLDEFHGSASEPVTFATPACEPDPPQPPKVVQRNKSSLQLRWNAPVDNGSHIIQYALECDDGSGWVEVHRTKGKQHNLTKLHPATCYKFRLAAVNDCGRSAFSDVVLTSTAGIPPEMPSPPVLKEATVTSLHLAWQKRPSDEDFTLQMDDKVSGHGFLPIYNGKETHYKHHGLHRHSEYKFRLRTHNEEGSSRWSDEVCYRTLPDKPATPARPSVKGRVHAHNFKIKWDPPSDKGGVDIAAYILELNDSSGFESVYMGPETEFVCDRLIPGTTYQLRVACMSVGGRSDYSEPYTVTTEAVIPGQCCPPWMQGKPRSTTLMLKWGYPKYDGGAPLTEFEVQMTCPDTSSQLVYQGKETECVVTDLSPGQSYLFQVRASNRIGAGPWSTPVEVTSGAAPPDAPQGPNVACRSPHHVLVQWGEPTCNGAAILDYRLEMSTTENELDFSTVFHGLSLTYEVKGLAPATSYFFRVQANNSAGWSGLSPASHAMTPASSPAAVASPKCVATPTSLSLSWQEPACHGADILHYNVDTGDRLVATSGSELEYTIEGLLPDTTYRLRVQAVNSVGPGPFSPVLRATTLRTPPPPPKLELVNAYHNYLKLKWGDGKNSDFTRYVVEMEGPRSREFQMVYQGTSLSCKVNRLQELTSYRFRIAAVNDAGQGDFSDVQEYATTITPPAPPKAPKVTEIQQRGCCVEWAACKPVGGDSVMYQVQLMRPRDQDYRVVQVCDDAKAQLADLEPGTEYLVRVCPVRCAVSGHILGAASPSTAFTTSAVGPATPATPRNSVSQVSTLLAAVAATLLLLLYRQFTIKPQETNCTGKVHGHSSLSWFLHYSDCSKTENLMRKVFKENYYTYKKWFMLTLNFNYYNIFVAKVADITNNYAYSTTHTIIDDISQKVTEWKPLTDQQTALLILAGFTVFAVLVAAIVQHILPVSSH
ncbi:hypothetical protein PR048_031815 [Dryococelus australis]|uniref:Fibronectin type-III domain-containing protein n=1 Tax=Dryococelus australis TaxID=614101 RepID=A0ABQ9GAE1_9NEOP|nr:hypothetical protein PR048_031815 [Dryococelus australis]